MTAQAILQAVCQAFKVSEADVCGQSRQQRFVQPRTAAIYLMRKHLGMYQNDIGRIFDGRDHSTIGSAVRRFDDYMAGDKYFRASMREAMKELSIHV
jgi:chromosomal replication initiator protein